LIKKYIKEIEHSIATKAQKVEWKNIAENSSYLISDKPMLIDGSPVDVIYHEKESGQYRIVSVHKATSGKEYLCFYIYSETKKNSKKSLWLHRTRLMVFSGNAPTDQPFCLHIDGNAKNNSLSNLRWGSHKENMEDFSKHGSRKGSKNPSAKIDENVAVALYVLANLGLVDSRIKNELHISQTLISLIKTGGKWSHVTGDLEKIVVLAKSAFENKLLTK
jgi:hypothetical protein